MHTCYVGLCPAGFVPVVMLLQHLQAGWECMTGYYLQGSLHYQLQNANFHNKPCAWAGGPCPAHQLTALHTWL